MAESVIEEEQELEEEVEEGGYEEAVRADVTELEAAQARVERARRAKISLPEAIIIIMMAAFADTLEIVSDLLIEIPIAGQILWFFAFVFGLIISGIILLWTLLRGTHVFFIQRLIIILAGESLDAASGDFLPARTIAVVTAIWLSNRAANKDLKQALAALDSIKI